MSGKHSKTGKWRSRVYALQTRNQFDGDEQAAGIEATLIPENARSGIVLKYNDARSSTCQNAESDYNDVRLH